MAKVIFSTLHCMLPAPNAADDWNPVDDNRTDQQTVSLGPRMIASGGFDSLYRDGMSLIEEVASYLDGAGRADSKTLERDASLVYATESMRLTTRLMQLASWLLLQRAVNEGEITPENARVEKEKVKFSATPSERGGPGWGGLPEALKGFITKGDQLFLRVQKFDKLERGDVTARDEEPKQGDVADQLLRLKAAFGGLQAKS